MTKLTCSQLSKPLEERRTQIPLSFLIPTFNEASNLPDALASVAGWAEEVIVVDSLSTDQTLEIAEQFHAQVVQHRFEGYAKQWNWALENIPFRHEWVFLLDADERVTADLRKELEDLSPVLRDGAFEGFYVNRRLIFMGRWLKHGSLYPSWALRIFRPGRGRFEERPVNEHFVLEGKTGYLSQPLDHQDRRPLSDWISKHNRYAELEAEEFHQEESRGGYQGTIEVRFWGKQAERKRWIKLRVWNRLPLLLRPFLFFFRNYFLKGGFLDGVPGFIYHVLWSFWYPFLVSAKIIERRRLLRHDAVGSLVKRKAKTLLSCEQSEQSRLGA
jgi:glycosyltransferase involved in cell wall biosynthesis